MRFIADLHIHSRFSIATSPQLSPPLLDHWGRLKGIRVIGTGDATHPGWVKELQKMLLPAEEGLYRLNPAFRADLPGAIPETPANSVRFLVTAEVSTIYKKEGKVRKVHHLLLIPSLEAAERFNHRLLSYGVNLSADGRPILGMDTRDVLALFLEACPEGLFVPAHIWTPWFSVLGANSGFDAIPECFGDLSDHIVAVETGLSSDPPMNWRVSALDRYTLISNSDAHSPDKLGREANLFDTDLSFPAIQEAIRSGDPGSFLGTVEFFPQEGKYHHDGHRKCGVSWSPEETFHHRGICSVCGKPVVKGVLHRVRMLADREDPKARPVRHPYRSMIPLTEILAELHEATQGSLRIQREYHALIHRLGPELEVLLFLPLDEIQRVAGEPLAEAIRRMRAGKVHIQAGFDGEYGIIRLFEPGEMRRLWQVSFFENTASPQRTGETPPQATPQPIGLPDPKTPAVISTEAVGWDAPLERLMETLQPDQRTAVMHGEGPALVLAGPGTGKTHVLTLRIARFLKEGAQADQILAVTFTRKAAQELTHRIRRLLGEEASALPNVMTFHALGHRLLARHAGLLERTARFEIIDETERHRILLELGCPKGEVSRVAEALTRMKQNPENTDPARGDPLRSWCERYEAFLKEHDLFDLDDLIAKPLCLLESNPEFLSSYRDSIRWLLVDEFQDVNTAQYRLVRLLAPPPEGNLFLIGDPDQAIYGFRGSDVRFIQRFEREYPLARHYALSLSYRCPDIVLSASHRVLGGFSARKEALRGSEQGVKIRIVATESDRAEAEFVARAIEQQLGGLRFFSLDSAVTEPSDQARWGLSEIAVLCRTARQFDALEKAFQDHAIPYQTAGDIPFYQEEPIRTLLDLLRVASQDHGRPALWMARRFSHLPFGIFQGSDEDRSIPARIRRLLASDLVPLTPKDEPVVTRLLDLAEAYGEDIPGFLRDTRLGMSQDTLKPKTEAVSLLTLHAAKGLEFACVFITGCEEGLLPYRMVGQESDPEEERRLFYVGMTRAKKVLILTHARRRRLFGRMLRLPKTSFLAAIEEDLAQIEASSSPQTRPRGKNQLTLFS